MAKGITGLVDRINRPLLRWGLHPYRGSTLLMQVTGRSTGRIYDVPLWFIERGHVLVGFARRSDLWWRNLETNPRVTLWVRGHRRTATAQVVRDEPGQMTPVLREYLGRMVPRTFPMFFGIRLDEHLRPVPGELERASAEEVAMILLSIDC